MINIAHFDDVELYLTDTARLLRPSGFEVVRTAKSLREAKIVIPTLLSLGVVLALIDGDIGGKDIVELMTLECPSIITVGFATDPVPGAMHYIERTTLPDEFVSLVKLYTARTT